LVLLSLCQNFMILGVKMAEIFEKKKPAKNTLKKHILKKMKKNAHRIRKNQNFMKLGLLVAEKNVDRQTN